MRTALHNVKVSRMKNSVGSYTRLTEKEVTKVPIFEAGSFKYLELITITTTSTTTTHFQKRCGR
jgi:hypothetical protein